MVRRAACESFFSLVYWYPLISNWVLYFLVIRDAASMLCMLDLAIPRGYLRTEWWILLTLERLDCAFFHLGTSCVTLSNRMVFAAQHKLMCVEQLGKCNNSVLCCTKVSPFSITANVFYCSSYFLSFWENNYFCIVCFCNPLLSDLDEVLNGLRSAGFRVPCA